MEYRGDAKGVKLSVELTIEILSEEIDLAITNSNSLVFLVGVVSTDTGAIGEIIEQGLRILDVFVAFDLNEEKPIDRSIDRSMKRIINELCLCQCWIDDCFSLCID